MAKLTEKHLKLLELVKRNKYTDDELAEKVGFSPEHVNNLLTNSPTCGEVGKEFQEELKKVDKEVDTRISRKTNTVREKLVNKLMMWVESIGGADDVGTKTKHKMLVDAINAINKSMPYMVNIENYSWKDGITTEEAINEFKRLKAMATLSVDRRRISEFAKAGTAEGVILDRPTDQEGADAQDTALPADRQAEAIPYVSGPGEGDIRRE